MNWITLIIAGLFEVVWAISMKFSHGFTKLDWTAVIRTVSSRQFKYINY